jgi:uncharacterized protein (TIRG00374 family)
VLRKRRGVLFISLGIIIFVVYLALANPLEALQNIGHINVTLFLTALVVDDAAPLLFAVSWYVILRGMNVEIRVSEAIQATFVSLFVVFIFPLPVGSEIIRGYLVRNKKNAGVGKAVASVLVHKSLYNVSFGAVITLAAIIVTTVYGGSIPMGGTFILFVVLFAAGSSFVFAAILDTRMLRWVIAHSPSWLKSRLFDHVGDPRLGLDGYISIVDEIGKAVTELKSKAANNIVAFLMLAMGWSVGSITTYLVALSLGRSINIWEIVLVYAVVEFIQQLNIIIPGGLGIVDAGLTGAFVLLGIPLSLAVAISLMTRLVTHWQEFVIYGVASIHYGYRESLKEYLN